MRWVRAATAAAVVLALATVGAANTNLTLEVDAGSTVTLECVGLEDGHKALWSYHNAEAERAPSASRTTSRVRTDGNSSLVLVNATAEDSRAYSCQDMESNESLHTVFAKVRTVPPAVSNVRVMAQSVFAVIMWDVNGDGGLPLTGYEVSHRQDRSHLDDDDEDTVRGEAYRWTTESVYKPNATTHTVFRLKPNTTYYFRICALNRLGCGNAVDVMADTTMMASVVEESQFNAEHHESSQIEWSSWKIVIGFFVTLAAVSGLIILGISLVMFKSCDLRRRRSNSFEYYQATAIDDEEEAMELVPHITLNPSFNIDMLEFIEVDDAGSANAVLDGDEVNLVNSPARHGSCGSLTRPNG